MIPQWKSNVTNRAEVTRLFSKETANNYKQTLSSPFVHVSKKQMETFMNLMSLFKHEGDPFVVWKFLIAPYLTLAPSEFWKSHIQILKTTPSPILEVTLRFSEIASWQKQKFYKY